MNKKIKLCLAAIVGIVICGAMPGLAMYYSFPGANPECIYVPLIVGSIGGAYIATLISRQEKPLQVIGIYLGYAAIGAIALTIPAVLLVIAANAGGGVGVGMGGFIIPILAVPTGAFIGLIVCSVRLKIRKLNS